jgi:AcrR family transcriptional regulator
LRNGYQATTLDEIASTAGFTKGAVYWHFPNKRALFLALVAESVEINMTALEGLVASATADPDRLKTLLGEWIDGMDARASLPAFGAELEIESRRDPEVRSIHQRMIVEHEEKLAAFLHRYFQAVRETPAMTPMELARALVTIYKGFALSRQNRPIDPPNSALVVRHLLGLPVTPNDHTDGQA